MKRKNNFLSKARFILIGLFLIAFVSSQAQPSIAAPDGYAGYQGTTGGGSSSPVTVSSASAFKSAVNNSNSAVIIVNGRLNLGGAVTIGSNKTIVGANSSSGLYGGTVKIQGSNYIIQNLTFGPSDGDVLEVSGATKVYITKCSFHDSSDELCSIVRAADYVTVSWCKFYFDSPDSHSYAHLIGNSDGATGDRGKLHVTLHHNWYDNGVKGRQPRVRFGYVHLYNNYYNSNNTGYCIGIGYECHIRLENTHFDNINNPWADYGGTSNGEIGWSGLKFEGCSLPTFMSNSFPVFSPPYSFSLDPVNNVESLVKAGAGNLISNVGTTYNLTTSVNGQGSVSPSSGSYSSGTAIALTAIPASGWQFDYWSGDVSGTSSTINMIMDSDKSVIANFTGGTGETLIIQENETGFVSCDGSIDSNNSGFTGDGFANTDNASGNGVNWTICVPEDGTYSLVWRFANGSTDNRTAQVEVDGSVKVSNISFPTTGSWTSWTNSSTVNVTLAAGTHQIRLEATISSGLANIDYIFIAGNNPQAGVCANVSTESQAFELKSEKVKETISFNQNVLSMHLYPNPVNDLLNIEFSRELTGNAVIYLFDMTGKAVISDKVNGSSHILDMSGLPKGLYMIRVTGENMNRVERIVKQ